MVCVYFPVGSSKWCRVNDLFLLMTTCEHIILSHDRAITAITQLLVIFFIEIFVVVYGLHSRVCFPLHLSSVLVIY